MWVCLKVGILKFDVFSSVRLCYNHSQRYCIPHSQTDRCAGFTATLTFEASDLRCSVVSHHWQFSDGELSHTPGWTRCDCVLLSRQASFGCSVSDLGHLLWNILTTLTRGVDFLHVGPLLSVRWRKALLHANLATQRVQGSLLCMTFLKESLTSLNVYSLQVISHLSLCFFTCFGFGFFIEEACSYFNQKLWGSHEDLTDMLWSFWRARTFHFSCLVFGAFTKATLGASKRLHAKRYVCIWRIIGIGRQSRWHYWNSTYVTCVAPFCGFQFWGCCWRVEKVLIGIWVRCVGTWNGSRGSTCFGRLWT